MAHSKAYAWQSGPFKLIETPSFREPTRKEEPAIHLATMMALIHNAWIRALNSIYQAAPHVPESEYFNFVRYAWLVYGAIKRHHDEEEEFVFPLIEERAGAKDIMATNVEQHEAFETGLRAFAAYLSDMVDHQTHANFDGQKLRQLIDVFRDPLQTHLEDEIHTLVRLAEFPHLDIHALMEKAHKDTLAHMSWAHQRDGLPVLLLNHDMTYEDGMHGSFPPLPAPLSFVFRRVVTFWNAGSWKFTTCDATQRPKELLFRGSSS